MEDDKTDHSRRNAALGQSGSVQQQAVSQALTEGCRAGCSPACRGDSMAGLFELFVDAQSQFRFRLLDGRGLVLAVSSGFDDKLAAVAGIYAVRECAGTGLITDLPDPAPETDGSDLNDSRAKQGPSRGGK
jgi:uncharacterized protein YegP (UPF0339 family)